MNRQPVDELRSTPIPEAFSRKKLGLFPQVAAREMAQETAFLRNIAEILKSKSFLKLVDGGFITLAMVKPQVDLASHISASDSELASQLLGNIKPPLEVIAEVSILLNEAMINTFYSGKPKEVQLAIAPVDSKRYGKQHKNRWEEFVSWMQQGPVTYAILYSAEGNAPALWRAQMGDDWNIARVKQSAPDSIRARFAAGKDEHNNLLHGSDSSESARREISLLVMMLQSYQPNQP